ncbi:hypothetical protein, partial [Haloarcula marismortui]|uniref:hypothetical protein n=1 Tax=Haloarcula marismortui TaxID=2238 RepID=UPI0019D3C4B9
MNYLLRALSSSLNIPSELREDFRVKSSLIVVMFTIATILVVSSVFGRLYPFLSLGIGICSIVIFYLHYDLDTAATWGLAQLVILSTFYRTYSFLYSYGFSGTDVNRYAFYISRLAKVGSITVIDIDFYNSAPLYFVFNSMTTLITGSGARISLVSVPILIGIVFPVIAFVIGRIFYHGDERVGLIASALTVVAPRSVWLSWNPIPQSISDSILAVTVFLLILYLYKPNIRTAGPIGILFFAMLLTHKISAAILVSGLVATLVIFLVQRQSKLATPTLKVSLILTAGLFLQLILTGLDDLLNSKLTILLSGLARTPRQPLISPAAAVPPEPAGFLRVLWAIGYWVPLFLLAGIGWLLILYSKREAHNVRIILGLVSIGMAVLLTAYARIIPVRAPRFMFLLIPFLGSLVGVTLIRIRACSKGTRGLRTVVVAILLIT